MSEEFWWGDVCMDVNDQVQTIREDEYLTDIDDIVKENQLIIVSKFRATYQKVDDHFVNISDDILLSNWPYNYASESRFSNGKF